MKTISGDSFALRLTTALVLLPLLAVLVWMPCLRLVFALLVVFLAFMGAYEYGNMIRVMDPDQGKFKGIYLAPLFPASLLFHLHVDCVPFLILYVVIILLVLEQLFSDRHNLVTLALTGFGVVYIGFLSSFFVAMHQLPNIGPGLVTLLVFTIGLSDTGAYLVGKKMGRNKLCPTVSPNKTIEGSVAGIVAGIVAGVVVYYFRKTMFTTSFPGWPLWVYVIVGVGLSLIGQIGDLAESMIKRNAGVKDSGTLFPGHGGALDRCDAFLLGGPALYYTAVFLEVYCQ